MSFRCDSCGKAWEDHDGIMRTCQQLQEAQKRIAELEAALKLARSHVISHHAAHLNGGELGWCPVCHKEDGTEPEMDLIDSALNGGAK